MSHLLFHIISGDAFFTGIALVILAVIMSARGKATLKGITVLAFLAGVAAIVLSATALSWWCYGITAAATLAWIASWWVVKWRRWTAILVIGVWLGAALIELPHHIRPKLSPAPSRDITIIGDSLTAGIGNEAPETWPVIFSNAHAVQVQDLSLMGETTSSALTHSLAHDIHSPVVIVEIGGNDLLGTTTAAKYARDLDALLAHLTAPGRQIMMFELPLPPSYNEFGRIQRVLAKKHHVKLVPRRILLSIIADSDSTLDTLHLTEAGHHRMAYCVWQLVKAAFPTNETLGR